MVRVIKSSSVSYLLTINKQKLNIRLLVTTTETSTHVYWPIIDYRIKESTVKRGVNCVLAQKEDIMVIY